MTVRFLNNKDTVSGRGGSRILGGQGLSPEDEDENVGFLVNSVLM